MYIQVVRSLGVEVSDLKTHKSNTFFEFTKRIFYRRSPLDKFVEVTPFPISALQESRKRYYTLTQLLLETESKGWVLPSGIPAAVNQFYRRVAKMRSKYCRIMEQKSIVCEVIMKIMKKSLAADLGFKTLIRYFGLSIPEDCLNEYMCLSILSNVAVEMFAENNPTELDAKDKQSGKGGKPLGLLAESLVIRFSGIDSPDCAECGFQLIYALPILQVYGKIEEEYMNLTKEVYKIDTLLGGE